MNAKNSVVDQCSQRQVVKCLIEIFPWCGTTILLDDLIIETINSGYLPGFVVATQQQYLLGELDLIAKEKLNRLD